MALFSRWVWSALAVFAAGCATPLMSDTAAPAQALNEPVALRVADGVYMLRGASGEVDADTLGRIGNAGFIVGDSGVIAIDTGTSYRHGVALLKAIGRVTDKPIRQALITQVHQEFLFGAAAYRERGIPVHMHRQAAGLMASRCENCLKTLKRVLGEDEMRGTAMFKADEVFDQAPLLQLIGRPVQVLHFGHSSGPGDIAVLDMRSGVLFAGGLVDHLRIPDVQDGELPAWHAALKALSALPLRHVVPGHGPATTIDGIATVQRYLTQLQARVLELIRSGAALSDVPDSAVLPEFKDWDQYDIVHRRNASVLFVRMEREQMFK